MPSATMACCVIGTVEPIPTIQTTLDCGKPCDDVCPLVYFHGIVEGKYEAEYPVFIVGDSPESLTFTVTVDERRFASLGNVPDDPLEIDIRRRYITRTVQQRLHQQEFRERVLEAYQ